MSNSDRFNFNDFTRTHYARLLGLAKRTYVFRTFDSFNRNERFILWRHDVDFSVQCALNLARLEAEAGVVATYFLSLHSEFYNLLDHDNVTAVRDIIGQGHRIGLHFDAAFHGISSEAELEYRVLREKSILEDFFESSIPVFSFHNPTPFTLGCRKWCYGGLINAYADYFQAEVGYCSDSNGFWRHRRLEDVLTAAVDERLQVLTHPGWWQETLMSPKERIWRCIEGRAQRTKNIYQAALMESSRENIDWE